jgi:hypothetical protein
LYLRRFSCVHIGSLRESDCLLSITNDSSDSRSFKRTLSRHRLPFYFAELDVIFGVTMAGCFVCARSSVSIVPDPRTGTEGRQIQPRPNRLLTGRARRRLLGTRDAIVRPVCVATSLTATVRIADPPLRGFPTRVQNQGSKGRRVCLMVLTVSSRRPPGECDSKQSGAGPGDTAFQCIQDILLHNMPFRMADKMQPPLCPPAETLDRSFCSGKASGFLIPVWSALRQNPRPRTMSTKPWTNRSELRTPSRADMLRVGV